MTLWRDAAGWATAALVRVLGSPAVAQADRSGPLPSLALPPDAGAATKQVG